MTNAALKPVEPADIEQAVCGIKQAMAVASLMSSTDEQGELETKTFCEIGVLMHQCLKEAVSILTC